MIRACIKKPSAAQPLEHHDARSDLNLKPSKCPFNPHEKQARTGATNRCMIEHRFVALTAL